MVVNEQAQRVDGPLQFMCWFPGQRSIKTLALNGTAEVR